MENGFVACEMVDGMIFLFRDNWQGVRFHSIENNASVQRRMKEKENTQNIVARSNLYVMFSSRCFFARLICGVNRLQMQKNNERMTLD